MNAHHSFALLSLWAGPLGQTTGLDGRSMARAAATPLIATPQWWGTSMFGTRLTSTACAMNNKGFIVGYVSSAYNDPGYPKAVVWEPNGDCETLNTLWGGAVPAGAIISTGIDINDDNMVIAQMTLTGGATVPVALRLPFSPKP
jgi:hypothetical protein